MYPIRRMITSVGLGLSLVMAGSGIVTAATTAPAIDPNVMNNLATTQAGFRQVHDLIAPAVVSITSTSQTQETEEFDPFDFFFGGGGRQQEPQVRRASGSGVIIRPEGIVLTNSHVVTDATKVTVQLPGSDKQLPAEVVQTDPRTDLAIVRITEPGTYPTAKLGDAKSVQVGDWAIAIGSPFNLTSTMTVGIISATGRKLTAPTGDSQFQDLLQTDASINPGNSGGPLVNIRGEIVGINFMIYSPSDRGGNVGIGFAIPINDYTREVIDSLVSGRAYVRGRLGVYIKNLDDAMRESYGVKAGGVFIDSAVAGEAAAKAGVKDEDIITAVDDTPITDMDQFSKLIERTKPGTEVKLTIIREKKPITLTALVGGTDTTANAQLDETKVGISVTAVTPDIVNRYNLPEKSGVILTRVMPGSPAEDAGLQRGDIILRVNGNTISSTDEFWKELTSAMNASKHGVLLRIRRGARTTTVTLQQIDLGK